MNNYLALIIQCLYDSASHEGAFTKHARTHLIHRSTFQGKKMTVKDRPIAEDQCSGRNEIVIQKRTLTEDERVSIRKNQTLKAAANAAADRMKKVDRLLETSTGDELVEKGLAGTGADFDLV